MKYFIPTALAAALFLTGCEPNYGEAATEDTQVTTTSSAVEITEPSENDIESLISVSENNTKIGWGLGKETDANGRPLDAINANERYGALGGKFIGSCGDKIMLTFDEGYENGLTGDILDTLKEKNVRAVFFVTYDYCKGSPELVQRMIDEGHTVGNHSYTHPSFPDLSEAEMADEVMKLHNYVRNNFNYSMSLFRFPRGEFSEKALSAVQSLGYESVFWSFAYLDWDVNNQPNTAEALEKITNASHKGGIFLLHAVSRTNAEILGEVIDFWRGKGLI